MSNIQLVSNNAKTTLAAQLLVGATTMTVAVSGGALFRTIAAPNYELITLQRESDGAIEIIRVTTHTAANDVFAVIARGEEGTTPLQFEIGDKVQGRWTRGTAERVVQNVPFTGVAGTNSIDLQSYRSNPATVGVTGNNSVGIGREVTISGSGVGIGSSINITAANGVAIGESATVGAAGGIAIGFSGVQANGAQAIAIGGSNLQASAYRAMAIGWDFNNAAPYSIAMGAGKFNAGNYSVSIGNYGTAGNNYSLGLGAFAYANGNNAIAVGAQSTANGLNRMAIGYSANAGSTYAMAIGFNADVTGSQAMAIGYGATAVGNYSTVIGRLSSHAGPYGVALGAGIAATGYYAVAVGAYAQGLYKSVAVGGRTQIGDDYAVAIGYDARALGTGSVSIGFTSRAANYYAVVIGHGAQAIGGAAGAISIGYSAYVEDSPYAIGIGANVYMSGVNRAMGLGFEARPGAFDVAHIAHPIVNIADHAGVTFGDARARFRQFGGVEVVLTSKDYDLTDVSPFDGGTLGTKDFWVMPAGVLFYPDEVGIVTKAQTAVTVGPTASFGHGGAGTQILNNQAFASGVLGQVGGRGQYASAAPQGVGIVSIAMNVAATATALTGRFFVRGMMVES